MKMTRKKIIRIGAIRSELEAAKVFDFISIMTQGLQAKTNFDYSIEKLLTLLDNFFGEEDGPIDEKPEN